MLYQNGFTAAIKLVERLRLAQSKESFEVLFVHFNEYLDKEDVCWLVGAGGVPPLMVLYQKTCDTSRISAEFNWKGVRYVAIK